MKKTVRRESGAQGSVVEIASPDSQSDGCAVMESFHVVDGSKGQASGVHCSVRIDGEEYQIYILRGGPLDALETAHPAEAVAGLSADQHARFCELQNPILRAASEIAGILEEGISC